MSEENKLVEYDPPVKTSIPDSISNLVKEQSFKLGEALTALRRIKKSTNLLEAKAEAREALERINDYDKGPEDI